MIRQTKKVRRSRHNVDCASANRARGRGIAVSRHYNSGIAKQFPKVRVRTKGLRRHQARKGLRRAKRKGEEMKSIICSALMALTITMAEAAEADQDSANYLLPYCKLIPSGMADRVKAFQAGRCAATVQSVAAFLNLLKEEREKGRAQVDPTFCADIPHGVTNSQLVQVVIKFSETHPEMTHVAFGTFSLVALNVTWPCKE
jgi:hypothetical protein